MTLKTLRNLAFVAVCLVWLSSNKASLRASGGAPCDEYCSSGSSCCDLGDYFDCNGYCGYCGLGSGELEDECSVLVQGNTEYGDWCQCESPF